jgi:hypothetical protein
MSVETQRRGLADNDPRHGTLNGYSNLGCRCDGNYGCRCRDCTTAWTDEHRARRQRRQREDARWSR